MRPWEHIRPDQPAVLVTVAVAQGSCPREAGACMAVTADGSVGTVGGGHLELEAIRLARAMLAAPSPPRLERYALGPSLGQCCGGVVWLAFDRLEAGEQAALRVITQGPAVRLLALDGSAKAVLDGAELRWTRGGPPARPNVRQGTAMLDLNGQRWLRHVSPAPLAHVVVFGAGHVGRALVQALSPLDCRITWVDQRDDEFPAVRPAQVQVEATDVPESVVAEAPPGATYLVLTHSHALDLSLTEAILRRGDAAWVGLIGSLTKRRQFEYRLRERGIAPERLAALVCPIGLPAIRSKAPAAIAASVTAQLLMAWEAARSRPTHA